MSNHAKSHYRHGRKQLATDVETANRAEIDRRHGIAAHVAAARQAERDRPRLGHADIVGARQILPAGSRRWLDVIRVNATTVTVNGWLGPERITFARVADVRRTEETRR